MSFNSAATGDRLRRGRGKLPEAQIVRGAKPFPFVVERLRTALDATSRHGLDALQRQVYADPALAAQTIRLANSARFRPTDGCERLDEAIARMGARPLEAMLSNLVADDAVVEPSAVLLEIRRHSLSVAAIMAHLGRELGHTDPERIYLVGLLHDVGKLLAAQGATIDYRDVPDGFKRGNKIVLWERKRLGYDHATLGAHALSVWGVPEPIPTVVAWHHQSTRAYVVGGDIARLAALIRLGNRLEELLENTDELDHNTARELELDGACPRLKVKGRDMQRQWETLLRLREEAHTEPEP